ncbi:CDP-glucose 4,6-dehydratase [Acutalibacter sp. 1XD8-33]|uniref:CDP-glucose 4,6-dehydratase n=1 Tax=Acutalibacter sp. 1XD8-33 TaxID=2320081 RepID=UPI0018F6E363|nr:CDP-glucose 4,6-dehydratase [Acutalibacter sp. 1XD8-33]
MMNLAFLKGKRVFVTGHTGFKGAWLCRILVGAGAEVTGYSLPPPTEPNLFSLAGLDGRMTSVLGDIRDRSKLEQTFHAAQPEIVFHLAAQPIVRDSYKAPVYTYEINVMGTVNLLECIRTSPNLVKSVVIVTTDKVYENQNWAWGYRESDPLDGHDPYSNSKSCAELVTHSYVGSFFADTETAVSTVRAGNVIGGGDFANDRIIPDCVRAVQSQMPIVVRNPHSVRPYQHVLEALFAYLLVAQRQYENKGDSGWYNVGPEDEDCLTTGALTDLFCQIWGEGAAWENRSEAEAPHEDQFLKLDCSKLKSTFHWRPRWNIAKAVGQTVKWTKIWLENGDLPREMDRQIEEFLNKK